MAKRDQRRPTDAEIEILRVLWERGPSTVREVHRTLEERRGTGYTTVLKLMQIMTEKGLVERDASVRPQVYRTTKSARQMQQRLVGDLLDRIFDGSPGEMVLRALSSRKTTPDEREKIRRMLDELEDAS